MVQTRSGAGHNAEIQESLRVLRRNQLISLALSVVCVFCSTYCAIYIRKSVEESSESFGELSFFRESFTKEMKESNSSLRESLQNLTRSVAEFYHFFVKEIQGIRTSQVQIINLTKNSYDLCDSVNNYSKISIDFNKDIIQEIKQMREAIYNIQNQTKNSYVAVVEDSKEFSDSLSAEFADKIVFTRFEELRNEIVSIFLQLKQKAEYILKIKNIKLFNKAKYILELMYRISTWYIGIMFFIHFVRGPRQNAGGGGGDGGGGDGGGGGGGGGDGGGDGGGGDDGDEKEEEEEEEEEEEGEGGQAANRRGQRRKRQLRAIRQLRDRHGRFTSAILVLGIRIISFVPFYFYL